MAKNMDVTVALNGVDNVSGKLKGVIDRVGALTSKAKSAQDRLKQIGITQNQIKGFDNLKNKTNEAKTALEAARQKAAALERALALGEKVDKDLAKATRAVKDLDTKYSGLMASTRRSEDALRKKGITTENLAQKTRTLGAESEKLTRILDKQQQAESLRARSRSAAMTSAKMLAGGYVIGRGLSGMMAPGMAFDAEMSRVQALTRLSNDSPQLAALREQAKQLGATTSFTGGDVASGQAFLAMAGFTPDAIRAAMPGLLDMAKAGGIDLGRGADISSNILSAFGINPEEMDRVADVLTRTFTTSNTNLEMLGGTMKYVAPIAKAAGMSFEEAAAMAGLMGNIGIQDSMAGTQLRAMVNRLAAPVAKGREALESIGVSALDAQGNMRSLPTVLHEIAKATEGLGSGERLELLKHIFGEEASAGLSDLIGRAGSAELKKYIEVVQSSRGAAAAVAGTMANNLSGDLKGMSSAWESLAIGFSEANTGWIRSVAAHVTSLTRSVSEFVKENPQMVKVLTIIAAVVGVVLVVGGAVMLLFAGLLASMAVFKLAGLVLLPAFKGALLATAGALGTVFTILRTVAMFIGGALLTTLKTVFAFLMANPIVLAIMLIVGALYLLYRNWDAIWGAIKFIWADMTTWFTSTKAEFMNWGSEIISGLIEGIKGGASALWEGLKSTIGGAVSKVKDFLGIRSPSRVFAQLGAFTAAGMAMGIANGTPAVVSTAENMAREVSAVGRVGVGGGSAAQPGGGAGAGGMTIGQVTIVIDGTGLDAEAIARAVDQRLRQMSTQARTESQSRFFDE